MTTLYFLNKDDNLVDTITQSTGLISAELTEELNSVVSAPLIIRYSNDVGRTLNGAYVENSVVFRDKDGVLRLFTIKEVDEVHSFEGTETVLTCFPAFTEINHKLVRKFIKKGALPSEVLTAALDGTRWTGNVYGVSTPRNISIENKSALDVVWDIIEDWGIDIKDSVVFDGNTITERSLTLSQTIGFESPVWFEVGYNLQSISRTILSDPFTTIYPRGASLDTVSEDVESEGRAEYLDISDVEWSVANGDPVDKPLGQSYLTSPHALDKYGIRDGGNVYHREMFWEDSSIDNAETLASAAWKALQANIDPEVSYEISAIEVAENLRLGDYITVVDHNFNPSVSLRSRIVSIKYDLLDVMGTMVYEVGQILRYKRHSPIKDVIDKVTDKESQWDAPVTETSYPDIPPPIPKGVVVKGGFKSIFLSWNFVGDMSVKTFRVYASDISGFGPDETNLVYEGATNAFNHELDTNITRFYRLQAVNYRGRVSGFTVEFTASTVKIITDDMLFGSVNADILADLSVSAEKLADQAVNEAKLGAGAVTATKIANLAVGNAAIENGAITNAKIGTAAISTAQIQDAAITNAKVFDLSADKLTAGTIDANFINVVNLAADSLNVSSLSAITANLGTITSGHINGAIIQSGPTTINDGFVSVGDTISSTALLLDKAKIQFMGTVSNMGDPRESSYGGEISFDEFFSDHWGMNGNSVKLINAVGSIDISTSRDDGGITIETGRYANSPNSSINIRSRQVNLSGDSGINISGTVNPSSTLVVGNDLSVVGTLTTDSALVVGNGLTINGGNIRSTPTYNFTTSLASNMHIASSGLVYRSTSASKYKDDIQPITRVFSDILSLEPKSWWDKAELAENNGDTTGLWRHHGLIAEDLVNAGLDEMVIWYDGQPEGIQYERLAVYLIPIVRKLTQRVEELERVIK